MPARPRTSFGDLIATRYPIFDALGRATVDDLCNSPRVEYDSETGETRHVVRPAIPAHRRSTADADAVNALFIPHFTTAGVWFHGLPGAMALFRHPYIGGRNIIFTPYLLEEPAHGHPLKDYSSSWGNRYSIRNARDVDENPNISFSYILRYFIEPYPRDGVGIYLGKYGHPECTEFKEAKHVFDLAKKLRGEFALWVEHHRNDWNKIYHSTTWRMAAPYTY